ncbi:unnamed protein product [Oikopleura dioica]|uniref:Uncharacterized protein n=1 Tax=Oikopleura dioica TaxID=34765 RepID=E4XYD5_OIKDI|nr:unnamed protein product [Oikopleura dioica]
MRKIKKRRLMEMEENEPESSDPTSTRDGSNSGSSAMPTKRTRRLRSDSSADRSDSSMARRSSRRASISNDEYSSRPSNSDLYSDTDTDSTSMASFPSEDISLAAAQLINTAVNMQETPPKNEGIELIKGQGFQQDVNNKIIELESGEQNQSQTNVTEIEQFLKANVVEQAQGMRADRYTLMGRGICIAADKVRELINLLGPGTTREDLVTDPPGGQNVVLPETLRQLRIAISLGTLRRNKIRNHFKSRTVSISREFRQNWYSMCVNRTREIVEGLTEAINDRPSDERLIQQGLLDPTQFDKLLEIRDTLRAFLAVKTNKKAMLEIFGSGRTIIFCFLPAPGHDSIYHFIRSHILQNAEPIPMDRIVLNANQICRLMMEDLGLTFITTNTHRAVIGSNYKEGNEFHFNVERRMIISVSPSPTAVLPSNKYSLKLYRFTLRGLLTKKYKINPDSINFDNIDTLKLTHNDIYEELVRLYANISLNPGKINDIIDSDCTLGNQLTIIRSTPNQQPSTRRNNGREDMIRNLVHNGTVPIQPLPTNIPPPENFIRNVTDSWMANQILNKWKERRSTNNQQNTGSRAENGNNVGHTSDTNGMVPNNPRYNDSDNSPSISLSANNINKISAIENPSDCEINEIKELCKELNNINKQQAVSINCINTNPGLCDLKGEKFRDIVNENKNVDVVLANELRMERNFFELSDCWPEGFHCVTHNKIGNIPIVYSAILLRNSTMADYVVEKCSFGTITGILLENHLKQKLCIFSLYRPIPKPDNKNCFYKHEGRNDPFVFVEWLKQAREFARKHDAGVILAGDYNSAFDRETDDEKLSAALLEALKGLVDLCVDPTFFRKNCRPSTIDHVHVSDPKGTNLKNLRLHKTLQFDGHCGQSFRFNFGVARYTFKVTSSRILDKPEIIKEKALKEFNKMMKDMGKSATPEKRVTKAVNWTKKILIKCSMQVVKIESDKNEFEVKKGKDTIQYEEMKKAVTAWKNEIKAEKGHEVFIILSKLGVLIRKMKLRDKRIARIKLSDRAEGDKNIIWDVFNLECRPNALWNVDKEFTSEELANKVQELQESTASNVILDSPFLSALPNEKLEFFPYSVNGENHFPSILQKYNKLKNHTKGFTGINKSFLDLLPVAFMEPLLINPIRTCLDSGIYPEILRNSRVVILPKKAKGIRPLAISEVLNSVLEKVMVGTLNDYIEGTGSLPDQQSGFRSSMSCGTALFEILKAYEEDKRDGKVEAVIFLDAKNAFDETKRILLFADDTALVVGARNYTELVSKTNAALKLLEEALTSLGLMLVPSKTNILTFGKSSHKKYGMQCEFNMTDTIIKPVPKAKYLRSWIDSTKGELKLTSNAQALHTKMKGINCKASCITHSLSLDTNATLLRACAMGAFQHNLAVLPPLSNATVAKMQRTYDIGLEIGNSKRIKKALRTTWLDSRRKRFGFSLNSYSRIVNKLTKIKQPSMNNTMIRTVICNIQSVMKTGKSKSQCSFLCKNIALKIAGTNDIIARGIPHLKRSTNKLERRKRLININSPNNCEEWTRNDDLSLYSEIIMRELIIHEFVDFEIDPSLTFSSQGAKNRLWPLFACDWISEMPIKARKHILLDNGKRVIKDFFKKIHVHLEQSVYCIQCRPLLEQIDTKNMSWQTLENIIERADEKFDDTLESHKTHTNIASPAEGLVRWFSNNNLNTADLSKYLLNIQLEDQLNDAVENGISLKNLDTKMAVNIRKKEIKTLTIMDQHQLEDLQNRQEIVILPSAIIAICTTSGPAWSRAQLNAIEEMRLNVLNKNEGEWCKLINEYESQTGNAHRLAHGYHQEEIFNAKAVACHLLKLVKQGKIQTTETPRFDFLGHQPENFFIMTFNAKQNFAKKTLAQNSSGAQLGTWTIKPEEMREIDDFKISAFERLLLESSTGEIIGYEWDKIKHSPCMGKGRQAGAGIGGLYLTKWVDMKCPKEHIDDPKLRKVISTQWEDKMNEIIKTKPRFMMMAKHCETMSNKKLQILATELSFYY